MARKAKKVIKPFSVLNSAEHEIFSADKRHINMKMLINVSIFIFTSIENF